VYRALLEGLLTLRQRLVHGAVLWLDLKLFVSGQLCTMLNALLLCIHPQAAVFVL
jgi:hypothetical protein